jgi:hypothetical protein
MQLPVLKGHLFRVLSLTISSEFNLYYEVICLEKPLFLCPKCWPLNTGLCMNIYISTLDSVNIECVMQMDCNVCIVCKNGKWQKKLKIKIKISEIYIRVKPVLRGQHLGQRKSGFYLAFCFLCLRSMPCDKIMPVFLDCLFLIVYSWLPIRFSLNNLVLYLR